MGPVDDSDSVDASVDDFFDGGVEDDQTDFTDYSSQEVTAEHTVVPPSEGNPSLFEMAQMGAVAFIQHLTYMEVHAFAAGVTLTLLALLLGGGEMVGLVFLAVAVALGVRRPREGLLREIRAEPHYLLTGVLVGLLLGWF